MNPRHPVQDWRILPLLLALLLAAPSIAPGANQYWTNSAGGSYSNSANWITAVPAIADFALFTNANVAYSVTVGSSVTNAAATFSGNGATVVLNAAGNTLWVTNILTVSAGTAGNDSTLVLAGGTLNVTNISSGASMTLIGGSARGTLIVSNGAFNSSSVMLGQNAGAQGTLNVFGGTNTLTASGFHIILGSTAGSTGNLLLAGSSYQGAVVYATNADLRVGSAGVGVVTVSNGTWFGNVASLGVNAGAQGTLNLFGGSNLFKGNLLIGGNGGSGTGTVLMAGNAPVLSVAGATWAGSANSFGTMTVSNGTFLSSALLSLAGGAGSQGTLVLAGGTNLMTGAGTSANIQVGTTGRGSLQITDPASLLVATGTTYVGFNSGSAGDLAVLAGTYIGNVLSVGNSANATGTVLVAGNNAQVILTNGVATTTLGVSGVGTLTVSNGVFTSTIVNLGGAAGARGTLNLFGGTNNFSGATTSLGAGNVAGGTGTVLMAGNSPVLFTTNTIAKVGSGTAGVGFMTVSNGSWLSKETYVAAGNSSIGVLNHFGGTNVVTTSYLVAQGTGATGTVLMADNNALLVVTNAATGFRVGNGATSLALFTLSNGTLRLDNNAGGNLIANAAGANASLNVAGGLLDGIGATPILVGSLAHGATGTVKISGGTVNLSGLTVIGANTVTNSSATFQLSGGTVNLGLGNPITGGITISGITNDTATVQVSGGTLNLGSGGIALAASAAPSRTNLFLSGGTLGTIASWGSALNFALTNDVGAGTVVFAPSSTNVITLSGALSGNGTLVKDGTGVLALGGSNSFTGGLYLSNGTLSASLLTNFGNGPLFIRGGFVRSTAATFSNLNALTVNWDSFDGGVDVASATVPFTITNALSGAGSLTKRGIGTLALLAADSRSGATVVDGGVLLLTNNGTLLSTSGITVQAAPGTNGTLILDNRALATATANRIGDSVGVTLSSGSLLLIGSNATATSQFIEDAGALTIGPGASTITATNGATLRFASYTRQAGGTLVLSTNTSSGALGPVRFVTAPGASNGVIPSIVLGGTDWGTHDGDGSAIRAYSNYVTTLTGVAADNVRYNASSTLSANQTNNTLIMVGGAHPVLNLGGNTLTLLGGGLLLQSDSTTALTNGTVAFPGEGIIDTEASSLAAIAVRSVGLTKAGGGNGGFLYLIGNSDLGGGNLNINAGVVNATSNSTLANVNAIVANVGAGRSGTPSFTVNGGTVTANSFAATNTPYANALPLAINSGTLTLSNGINLTALTQILPIASGGNATLNLLGGVSSLNLAGGTLQVGSANSSGTLNVFGGTNTFSGTLAVNGSGATSLANFLGGTNQLNGALTIGVAGALTSQVIVAGPQTVLSFANANAINIAGYGAASLVISNNARVVLAPNGSGFLNFGTANGQKDAVVLVSDGGSLTSGYQFQFGNNNPIATTNMSLVVSNGGSASFIGGGINNLSTSNRIVVTGAGSRFSSSGGSGFGIGIGNGTNNYNEALILDGGFLNYSTVAGTSPGASSIGGSYASMSNRLVVAGGGSAYYAGVVNVGNAANTLGNQIAVSNGGNLTIVGALNVGAVAGANSNLLVVDGSASLATVGGGAVGNVGGAVGNMLVVTNGGRLVSTTTFYIGNAATNNYARVTGAGSVWSNAALQVGSAAGSVGNTLSILNGGLVVDTSGIIGNTLGATSNTVEVSGNGSTWNNMGLLQVGYKGAANLLVVSNGGAVMSLGASTVGGGNNGGGVGASNNFALVTDPGSVWSNSGGIFNVGYNSGGNTLVISNGGTVIGSSAHVGGNANGDTAPNNSVLVSGSGSVWSNATTLDLGFGGYGAPSNSLVINDGGKVFDTIGTIGSQQGSSNSSAVVSGTGSVWINSTDLNVGSGYGNTLVVTNGGTVISGVGRVAAFTASGNSNTAIITGSGSMWSNSGALYVGYGNGGQAGAANNSLTITSSGAVTSVNGLLGYNGANSSNNSILVTGSGSVWINSGTLTVGDSTGGGGNTVMILNGGTILNSSATIGNGTSHWNSVTVTGPDSIWRNNGTITVGSATSRSNSLSVTGGGLVESLGLTVNSAAGNWISNSGGVFQFTTTAPTITPNGMGRIALNNGTISFRGITNADVRGSLGNNQLTNLLFAGNNTFRLNNASNFSANAQNYTFDSGISPSNYVGLEMVNGGTAWKSAWLSLGSGGTMLVSNTAATVAGAVTNLGAITVANASVTWLSNVVLAAGNYTARAGTNNFGAGLSILSGASLSIDAFSTLSGAVTNNSLLQILTNAVFTVSGGQVPAGSGAMNITYGGTLAFTNGAFGSLGTGAITNNGVVDIQDRGVLTLGGSASTPAGNGVLQVSGGGTLNLVTGSFTIANSVNNLGTLNTSNALVTFLAPVVVSGVYSSDPSTNTFTSNVTVTASGALQGSNGDLYVFQKDLFMQSTNAGQFNLSQTAVLFTNSATHLLSVSNSGALDLGHFTNFAMVAQNFAIGKLSIAAGDRLTLAGNAGSNALYVGWLDIQGSINTNDYTSVTNALVAALYLPNINLYYDVYDSRNDWLTMWLPPMDGGAYELWGAGNGLLLPIPEPSTWLAMGGGLALLAFLRRRTAA